MVLVILTVRAAMVLLGMKERLVEAAVAIVQ